MKVKFLILCLMFSCFVNANDWHERKAEGWIWFEENEKKEDKPQAVPSSVQTIHHDSPSPRRDPEKELEAFKKEFERTLKIAVWDPSQENVLAFQKMQLIALEKSAEFSRVWQHNLLNFPETDPNVVSVPSSQYGIQIQKLAKHQEKEALILSLAQKYGLMFFYEGAKLTSQATAENIKNFAKKYNWKLYGISMDDTVLSNIENQINGKSLAQHFKITLFPSLFVVDPNSNEIYPIAYGMASQEKIEQNILIQFSARGNQHE